MTTLQGEIKNTGSVVELLVYRAKPTQDPEVESTVAGAQPTIDDGLEKDWVIPQPSLSSFTIVNTLDEASKVVPLPPNAAETDLFLLREMGFQDSWKNLQLLLKYKGDLAAVVEILLAGSK